jgi:hypothetical protein
VEHAVAATAEVLTLPDPFTGQIETTALRRRWNVTLVRSDTAILLRHVGRVC